MAFVLRSERKGLMCEVLAVLIVRRVPQMTQTRLQDILPAFVKSILENNVF